MERRTGDQVTVSEGRPAYFHNISGGSSCSSQVVCTQVLKGHVCCCQNHISISSLTNFPLQASGVPKPIYLALFSSCAVAFCCFVLLCCCG